MAQPPQGQGQGPAPSSPSWSVPLHRPPPGVVYEESQPSGSGSTYPPLGIGGYTYPPPPPPPTWGSGRGMGVGMEASHTRQGSGEWFPTESMYPPPPPPPIAGPSSSIYTPPNREDGGGGASSTPDQTPAAAGKEKSGASKKNKRKKGSPVGETEKEKEKRTKTGRACDACRTKKIRCDILSPEDSLGREALCAHCKQYDLECTFFLPITETRFKKRRQTEDSNAGQSSEQASMAGRSPAVPVARDNPPTKPQDVPTRLEGPTSLSFLLHTALPAKTSEAWDLRHHNKWEISEDGNGMIRVNAPPTATGYADADPDDPTRQHNRLNRPILSAHTISLLVNAYFDHLAPLFPVVSRTDFAAKANPSPLLLYSICGLAATMRQFPREVFAGVRGVINGLLRSNDILSDARFEHVQALLILGQAGDLHAQPTAATASASLIRMGTATRMAQDLGLHRESNLPAKTAQDLAYVELRRRVWAACVIFDRWYGAALGIPLLVDLCDCDVLLPAPYEVIPDTDPSTWPIEPSFMALAEHLKLSILVGRVLKTIYSPTGLKHATDEQLETLLADMDSWLVNLPEELQYKGPQSSHTAGLLHLGHCALQFLFWRVFMRITYTCPPHLTVGLKVEQWSKLVRWGQESIDWLHHNDTVLDTLFIYPYTATNAALIQYHTWARRKDPTALESLNVVRQVASDWERIVQPDQMSIRRKTCETMTLLYEAALKTTSSPGTEDEPSSRPNNVNPTPGVHLRDNYGKSVFVKDPTRPGGGVFVAQSQDEKLQAGLQPADIVLASEYGTGTGTGTGSGSGSLNGSVSGSGPGPGLGLGSGSAPNSSGNTGGTVSAPPPPVYYSNGLGLGPGPQYGPIPTPTPNSAQTRGQTAPGPPGQGQGDVFQNIQMQMGMGATNVNPNINVNLDFGQAPNGMNGMNGMQTADGMVLNAPNQDLYNGADTTGFDASLLEGLPLSQFNWTEWNTYFEQMDKMQPGPGHGAGGGGAGGGQQQGYQT